MIAKSNLILISLIALISSSKAQTPQCADDPFFTFGRFTWVNGKGQKVTTTRTCAWLNEYNASKRKAKWCGKKTKLGISIGKKCPVTCGTCPLVPLPDPSLCKDSPKGWTDTDGHDCEFYAQDDNCETVFGRDPKFGKTAKEACCACGGGCEDVRVEDSLSSLIPWYDSDGKTCKWYEGGPLRCAIYEASYKNFGYFPRDACCVCGGGNKFIPST